MGKYTKNRYVDRPNHLTLDRVRMSELIPSEAEDLPQPPSINSVKLPGWKSGEIRLPKCVVLR